MNQTCGHCLGKPELQKNCFYCNRTGIITKKQ